MKTLLVFASAVLFTAFIAQEPNNSIRKDEPVLPQELRCGIQAKYARPITMGKLHEAGLVSELISGYPVNWITEYISVELKATCKGKTRQAVGPNDVLTAEQRNILKTVDLGSDIVIHVKYKYNDGIIDYTEDKELHVTMTLVPETEAEFMGGSGKLKEYVKSNISDKISETIPAQFQKGVVLFTVDEEGKIMNAKITQTSGDLKTDRSLLDMVYNMPKWKPAENSKGMKVKQEFVLRIGNNEGC